MKNLLKNRFLDKVNVVIKTDIFPQYRMFSGVNNDRYRMNPKKIGAPKIHPTRVNLHYAPDYISSIIKKHWRTMVQDPRMKKVFQSPPMVAYRRPPNLGDKLIRSRTPDPPRIRPETNTWNEILWFKLPNLSLHRAWNSYTYNPLIPVRRLRLMELSTV